MTELTPQSRRFARQLLTEQLQAWERELAEPVGVSSSRPFVVALEDGAVAVGDRGEEGLDAVVCRPGLPGVPGWTRADAERLLELNPQLAASGYQLLPAAQLARRRVEAMSRLLTGLEGESGSEAGA